MKRILLLALVCAITIQLKAQTPPVLVADLCNGCNSNTTNLFVKGSNLMFVAKDSTYGRELRSYDGTNPPSVTDIFTGMNSGTLCDTFQQLTVFNDTIYFRGTLATGKSQLMKWNGIDPPSVVTSINSSGTGKPDAFAEVNGKIYFAAWEGTPAGDQIYQLDPNTNNVQKVTDISHISDFFITEAVSFKNKLYFVSDRGSDMIIYVYDPSTNIDTVAFPTYSPYYDAVDLTVIDTMLYFSAISGSNGRELYSYDGYADTPTRLTDVSAGTADGVASSGIIGYQNKVYFFGNDMGIAYMFKLWYYDPATQQVNSTSTFDVGTHPDHKKMLAVYQGRLMIKAKEELAFSDGSNVTLLTSGDFNPSEAVVFQGDLYMNGYTTATERALFKIDTSYFYLNVPKVSLNGSAVLYPNPATQEINIDLTVNAAERLTIQIIDINGRIVHQEKTRKYSVGKHRINIPIADITTGIYQCVIYNDSGHLSWQGKFTHN